MTNMREPIREMLLQQVLGAASCAETLSNPTVLSCGGMYIPHHGSQDAALYQIITTPSISEPVKVVTGSRPHNVLYEALIKESMN